MDCDENDLASYANDIIIFTNKKRSLLDELKSDEPFYKKHVGINVNAKIKSDTESHRAYLIAIDDINIDEEIYCHYNFPYWFSFELNKGLLIKDLDSTKEIYEYPAFTAYVREFYPNSIRIAARNYDDTRHLVMIYYDEGSWYGFLMTIWAYI